MHGYSYSEEHSDTECTHHYHPAGINIVVYNFEDDGGEPVRLVRDDIPEIEEDDDCIRDYTYDEHNFEAQIDSSTEPSPEILNHIVRVMMSLATLDLLTDEHHEALDAMIGAGPYTEFWEENLPHYEDAENALIDHFDLI